jgi:enoyl-CoA hydratase/carnithine racemase
MYKLKAADMKPQHFKLEVANNVATITLNRPERKNPLTFESYAELRDTFHKFQYTKDVRAVVITGAGGNFCSGGDVHEIIGPLTKMDMTGLLEFTRMTGNLVKEMRNCPQPIIAAVDGICCGAGAIIAMASDMRYATARPRPASFSSRSAWPAATWAPAASCRASSVRAAPRNCCTPGA